MGGGQEGCRCRHGVREQCQRQDYPPQEGKGHNRPKQGAASSGQGCNQFSVCPTLIVWHGVCQVKAMRASLPTKPDTRSPFRGGPPQEGGRRQVQRVQRQQQQTRRIPTVPEGRSSEQLQALPQGVPEARTSQELMHQSHAISPPLVLTNIISQLKGWGVVPLKAPKAVAGRLQYHLSNWERVTKDRWVLDTVKDYLI